MTSPTAALIAAFVGGFACDKVGWRAPAPNCWCECSCAPYLSKSAVLAGALVGFVAGAAAVHLLGKVRRPPAPIAVRALAAAEDTASVSTQTGSNLALLRR